MKRVISLLLVCCTLALALVACGGGGEKNTGTQGATQPPKETDIYGQDALLSDTDWNAMDFDGEQLVVMVRNDSENRREWGKEEVGEDELDLAIYNRNEVVADTLNLEVKLVPVSSSGYDDLRVKTIDLITNDVNNKLHEYDIVAHFAYVANQPALKGFQADLMDEDTFPHFDFSLPCWNQAIVNNVAVNDTLYAVAGDLNISMFNRAMIMWHNKDLYTELRDEEDPEDIQDVVIAGKWTYAELYKWSTFSENADSDGDCGDVYGLYTATSHSNPVPFDAIPYAFDVSLITTNGDGTHSFNCIGNTKAEQAMKDWINLYKGEGNGFAAENCSCALGKNSHFVDGNILFRTDILYLSEEYNIAIREMEDTYSILPLPKYQESQTNYATTAADSFTLISVIDHSENSSLPIKGEAISAYLQFATEYSYTHVRGYYFERIVKPKFFGTDDSDGHVTKSIRIFVNIIDNLKFEFHTLYSPMLNDVAWLWRDTMYAEKTIQSQYEANKKTYEDSLYELDKWLGLIN